MILMRCKHFITYVFYIAKLSLFLDCVKIQAEIFGVFTFKC